MSVLNVNEIHDTTGNQALTINSSGIVTKPQLPFVAVDMNYNAYKEIANNTTIPFENVYEGDSSLWDATNYEFTCPVAGVYLMTFIGLLNTSSSFQVLFQKNNSTFLLLYVESERGLTGSTFVNCAAGDTLRYWHASGGSRNIYGGTTTSRYTNGSIALIG